jgi:hypothetical protein
MCCEFRGSVGGVGLLLWEERICVLVVDGSDRCVSTSVSNGVLSSESARSLNMPVHVRLSCTAPEMPATINLRP